MKEFWAGLRCHWLKEKEHLHENFVKRALLRQREGGMDGLRRRRILLSGEWRISMLARTKFALERWHTIDNIPEEGEACKVGRVC